MTVLSPEPIRLFRTLPHTCGYYATRETENLVIDPESPRLAEVFPGALLQGYRRAGSQIYKPDCSHCHACIATRIDVQRFKPNRNQRRVAQRNADVKARLEPARFDARYFELYQRYLQTRHRHGGMDDADADDFNRFLTSAWSPTRFLVLSNESQLLAVAVTDVTPVGLSAVYTFFAPEQASRSLGTLAILSQIALARSMQLRHVYLGYWIEGHPKMHYKAQFDAIERYQNGHWQAVNLKEGNTDAN